MFNKLVASGRGHKGASSRGAMTVSIILHALMLTTAVYASTRPPSEEEASEEEVTFLEIETNEAEPEPPAPEPPPPTPVDVPPPPAGFQELIPPLAPPPVLPPVMENVPAVNPEDFSGVGIAGGRAEGAEGGVPQDLSGVRPDSTAEPGFAYQVAVLDSPPALANRTDVERALERQYPRLLQDAGISGTVTIRFIIEPDGSVRASSLEVVSATNDQFRKAAANVVEMMRFRPGRYRGEPVPVLTQMPISFEAGR